MTDRGRGRGSFGSSGGFRGRGYRAWPPGQQQFGSVPAPPGGNAAAAPGAGCWAGRAPVGETTDLPIIAGEAATSAI